MNRTNLLTALAVALISPVTCLGRDYHSFLRDKGTGEEIAIATVVLLASDSTTVAAITSDTTGAFTISGEGARWLQVTHLSYQTLRLELTEARLPDTLYMEQKAEMLNEVVATAERPVMKLVEGGIPSYDIDLLFANSPVTTAYEMLGRLPGMAMVNGVPQLVGTSGYTLVMNGKPSAIPQDQLLEMLKTTPVQMVASVEISYAPIARYRAKSPSINVVLKTHSKDRRLSGLSGQLFANYVNQYYDRYSCGGNIVYSAPSGISLTANYSGSANQSRTDLSFDTAPFGQLTKGAEINNVGDIRSQKHNAFAELGYEKDKRSISLTYYGSFIPTTRNSQHDRLMTDSPERLQEGDRATNHVALEYTYDELLVGAFYTHYRDHAETTYGVDRQPMPDFATHYLSDQTSQVAGAHIDNSHRWESGWTVEYGSKVSYSDTKNRQEFLVRAGETIAQKPTELQNRELLADVYAGVSGDITTRVSAGLTLVADYAKYYDREETFQIIPQAHVTYVTEGAQHILQFNLQSEKTFPSYWELEPFVTIQGAYQQWEGNPELRPFVDYSSQLTYILKQKYIFFLGNNYAPNYFSQQIYLDPNQSKIIYKTWNWDYYNSLSLGAVIPVSPTSWWSCQAVVNGQLNSVKMDVPFEDLYEKTKPMLFASLNNDFTLGKGISLGLDGSVVHGGTQGYYGFSDMWTLTARAKWTSADKKWTVTLRGYDLLNSAIPKIKADYGVHRFDFQPFSMNRSVRLDLRYTFGGFKTEKKPTQLKTDRFGI